VAEKEQRAKKKQKQSHSDHQHAKANFFMRMVRPSPQDQGDGTGTNPNQNEPETHFKEINAQARSFCFFAQEARAYISKQEVYLLLTIDHACHSNRHSTSTSCACGRHADWCQPLSNNNNDDNSAKTTLKAIARQETMTIFPCYSLHHRDIVSMASQRCCAI
jgi:hypothetical protein